jgi:hypothetical protein
MLRMELHLDLRLFISQLATRAYSERVREDLTTGLQSGVKYLTLYGLALGRLDRFFERLIAA